jgi:hypothetical protein
MRYRKAAIEVAMNQFGFTKDEYDNVVACTDGDTLAEYASNKSRYIRARVAGNPHTPRHIRDILRKNRDEHSSIILWILGNPSCTKDEYREIFNEWQGRPYDGNVHISLAESEHATLPDLAYLMQLQQWCVTMAILNNRKHRTHPHYLTLIAPLLPDEDTDWEDWSEVEKLAFFRTYGIRRPSRSR